ncbi:MAG: thiamine pyrophosphate-dependent enzyme [Planctomycetota bacterium]
MATTDSAAKTIDKLALLELMYLSREGDRREGILLRQSKGWFQVAGMGHEGLATIAKLLDKDDYLFPYYRDRAMCLAKGLTNRDLAQAYFAKRDSSSAGRQMPGHYSSRKHNIWSVPTPTGGNLLPACGVAWGMQLEGKDGVVVATIGDAASRQGEFYEAVVFAVSRKLPIIFLIEDNHYGISTNTERFNPFNLDIFIDTGGLKHINARSVDVLQDYGTTAIQRARTGGGPSVLVCDLDRLCSHTSSDDHRVYRDAAEIEKMSERDPITLLANELIEKGELTAEYWDRKKKEIEEQVDREYREAEHAEDPKASEVMDELLGTAPTPDPVELKPDERWRMVDAVNQTLMAGLNQDRRRVCFGEDIEDPKGGVFGLTSGLSTAHPDRVFNSPLAEATIAGVACGLASYGMRPVFELQFVDFVGPAWNQISQNWSTLRWRTRGDWTCPIVLYAPYGAYLPGGSLWHSQANESSFAHVPGLRVVVPSTPEDASGLLWTAMHAEDPTIVLLPKHLIRQPAPMPDAAKAVPFGQARVRQAGSDVTLVCWGNCVEVAEQAVEQLGDSVSVELIDLRSIQPWDKGTIATSLAKTGRLVVVQEDSESCSVGQMIISTLTSNTDSFYQLLSAPRLVSKPDVHIGYNPIYEYAALPSAEDVAEAVSACMKD